MFSLFTAMGFPPNEFYADTDFGMLSHVQRVLKTPNLPLIELVVQFFSLIAPGGSLTPEEKVELLNGFYKYGSQKYSDQLHRVDVLIEGWKTSDQYSAEPYIISLFEIISAGPTWISYMDTPESFPDSVFFTSTEFTEQELLVVFNL